jgi:hypothetical protein
MNLIKEKRGLFPLLGWEMKGRVLFLAGVYFNTF